MLDEQERVEDVQEKYLRFTVSDRIEHWIQVITFVVLALTGLIQKWPQAGFSEIAIKAMGGIEAVRIIHRVFATILLLAVVYHVYTVGVKVFVKRSRRTMLPGRGDLKAAFHGLLYNLGLRKEHPPQGHFTWEEKIEYWAIVWGTLVMTVTGFMLWNPIATAKYLPGQVIPAAKAAHGGEALLAVLAILVWHFYHVHIKTFNTTIFTGYISREEMQREHALEFAEIESSGQPQPPDPAVLKKRRRIFLPIYAGVAAVLLAGIYLFVTIEETAITTIEPAEDVQVFVPSPNATVPLVTTTEAQETTTTTGDSSGVIAWDTSIEALFVGSCGACHSGSGGLGGLDATTYGGVLDGGNDGPGIVPGDPDESVIYTLQLAGGHPGQFNDQDLDTVLEWIENGAPEEAAKAGSGGGGELTWDGVFAGLFADKCGACHGALGGLNLTSYDQTLAGGNSGTGVVPGNPQRSLVYTRQLQGGHPGQLTDAQVSDLADWITAGAPEN